VDKGEDAVAAVGEPVTMALVDAGRAQRFIEQLIERAAELGLDRIGPAGGLLDVDGDDGPVPWQADRRPGPAVLVCRRERAGASRGDDAAGADGGDTAAWLPVCPSGLLR
jgi:hypothetical protein